MNNIDAVVTWVDGDDPNHRQKREMFKENGTKRLHHDAIDLTRFQSRGEIYVSVASILKYAKYINKIYIVTDNQTPEYISKFWEQGFCDESFIQIVDHKDIFAGYEQHLPIFNSLSIEAMLWRIKGLSDKFVYFNDDVFLNAPSKPSDFFVENSPVIRGEYLLPNHRRRKIRIRRFLRKIRGSRNIRPSNRIAQELGSNGAGVTEEFFHVKHTPHPMRKSTLEEYFLQNDEKLANQIKYKFRDVDQYFPISLANHLEIQKGTVELLDDIQCAYLKAGNRDATHPSILSIIDDIDLFSCIQSLDRATPQLSAILNVILKHKFQTTMPSDIKIS